MPLFGIFVVTLVLIIYRSWRALGALSSRSACCDCDRAADFFGWSHTVISTLVPLTVIYDDRHTRCILFTVYRARRLAALLDHHARALANKFLPCTASMFATAVGFGALAISDIRPVRTWVYGPRAAHGRMNRIFRCFQR